MLEPPAIEELGFAACHDYFRFEIVGARRVAFGPEDIPGRSGCDEIRPLASALDAERSVSRYGARLPQSLPAIEAKGQHFTRRPERAGGTIRPSPDGQFVRPYLARGLLRRFGTLIPSQNHGRTLRGCPEDRSFVEPVRLIGRIPRVDRTPDTLPEDLAFVVDSRRMRAVECLFPGWRPCRILFGV